MKNDNSANSSNQIRLAATVWAFRLIWQNCHLLVSGLLVCTVIRGLVPAVFALVIRGLINSVTETVGQDNLGFETQLIWLALALAITMFDVLARASSQLLSDRLKSDLTLKVNSLVIRHASLLDLPYMEDARNREVLDRVQQDPGNKLHLLFTFGVSAVLFAIQVTSLAAVLTWLEPAVLLFASLFAVPFFIFQWRLTKARYMTERNRTNKRRWTRYFLSKVTSPDTVGEIKLLGMGQLLARRFVTTMEEFRDQDKKLQFRQFVGGSLFGIVTTIAFYALFGRVVFKVYEGSLTVGDLAIFAGAVVRLRSALEGGIRHTARGYEQTLFIADLREFLDSRAMVTDVKGNVHEHINGALSVNGVSFSYPGSDHVVLNDISFAVGAGETIAIVGENGSGKSTLAKLLVRLYDVDQGTITLDGRELGNYPLKWLHSQVALLGQAFGKYEASIAENLAYGDWDRLIADRQEIERLAAATGVDHIAGSLPAGLDTTLGREFSEHDLSGGQWQLLAIARTLARRASVLILDEPTSNIDARSEYALFKAIGKLTEGITTVIISHRFSTIRLAERILVMHKGRIVEQGSHAELMSAGGQYENLYTLHEYYRVRGTGEIDDAEDI